MKLDVRSICNWIMMGILISVHYQCAKPSTLSGGPEDKTPPVIFTEKSTPNQQTQFEMQDIVLSFDEYIALKNVYSQVIISPPLLYNPKIKARGKKLNFAFDEREELKENATYVINFGNAIVDFNANNELSNYRFAFSTGDYIDSLSISGTVNDALTRDPVEEVLVMLYDNIQDSVVYLEKPFYFARTDKSGQFKIENLRSDTFKIFALKESNLNYIYDNPSEMIGYLDTLIVVNDSIVNVIDMEVFQQAVGFERDGMRGKTYGEVGLVYTSSPAKVIVSSDLDGQLLLPELKEDSLKVWYRNVVDSSFQLFLTDNMDYFDTIKVRKYVLSDYRKKRKKLAMKTNNLESKNRLAPFDTLQLTFTYPIANVDTDSISLLVNVSKDRASVQDTLGQISFQDTTGQVSLQDTSSQVGSQDAKGQIVDFTYELDSLQPRLLYIIHEKIPDTTYQLDLLPGSITDFYDISIDSMSLEYTVGKQEDYGTIHLSYDSLDLGLQYVFQLKDGDEVIRESIINDEKNKISLTNLLPQQYDCEILFDRNKNGKWDPGSYTEKTQSEVILRTSIESLRANWELNVFFINGEFREEPENQ